MYTDPHKWCHKFAMRVLSTTGKGRTTVWALCILTCRNYVASACSTHGNQNVHQIALSTGYFLCTSGNTAIHSLTWKWLVSLTITDDKCYQFSSNVMFSMLCTIQCILLTQQTPPLQEMSPLQECFKMVLN